MPNPIKLKRSAVADAVPSSLEFGELALNYNVADGKLYYKNSAGTIVAFETGGGNDARWDYFKPAAPTSVTATAGNAQAVVSWTAPAVVVPPATDYVVQFSSNSGSSWTTFSDGTSTSTSATVTGLTNGTAYTFRVAGVNGIGTGAFSTASSAVTPLAGDPYFSNVSLLLPFNGNLTDASSSPKTMTAFGNAAATGVAKFGSASLALDGTGDYLTTPSSTDFDLPGDFVIETWVRLTAPPSSFAGAYGAAVVSRYQGAGEEANKGFQLRINGTASEYDTINFYTGVTDLYFSTAVALNTWHHLAVARSGSSLRVYLNGSQVGSTVTNSDSLTPTSSRSLSIGRLALETVYLFDLPGQIDDLRITKGSDRGYTGATITVPTAAFPTSGVPFVPIPVMTSATAPSGTVSDSGVLEEAAPSWHAFNKANVADSTQIYASPIPALNNWIQYDFGFASPANGYQITSRQSAPFGSTQAPPSWTVSGSNDGTSFTTIDTRSSQTWTSTGEQKSFSFASSATYRYWRWTWGSHDTTVALPKIQLTA